MSTSRRTYTVHETIEYSVVATSAEDAEIVVQTSAPWRAAAVLERHISESTEPPSPEMMPHTPNGFDRAWLEPINGALQDRESDIQLADLTDELWDSYFGPALDAIQRDGLGIWDSDKPRSFGGWSLDQIRRRLSGEPFTTHVFLPAHDDSDIPLFDGRPSTLVSILDSCLYTADSLAASGEVERPLFEHVVKLRCALMRGIGLPELPPGA